MSDEQLLQQRLQEHLTAFYDGLAEDEQAMLMAVLARADGAEVTGFFDFSALSLLSQDSFLQSRIQRGMSAANEAAALASSIQKKSDDTASGIIKNL